METAVRSKWYTLFLRSKDISRGKIIKILCIVCLVAGMIQLQSTAVYATSVDTTTGPNGATTTSHGSGLSLDVDLDSDSMTLSGTLQILIVLTVLAVAPAILIMLTSFTRIIVVLHFIRTALGTQTAPPNQVLVGLTLFLTLFIMSPVFSQINETAVKPFDAGQITQEQALEAGVKPLREFMYKQTQTKDLKLFMDIAQIEPVESEEEIPFSVLVPSFILSELRTAFIIGFLIYIPFIVIDMVVASVLMSMGMMMLPPTTISMPFKILLFILADGWSLLVGSLVQTFY